MEKRTIPFLMAILLALPVSAAAPRFVAKSPKMTHKELVRKARIVAEDLKLKYLPQTEYMSFWNEDEEDWNVVSRTENTYNEDGTLHSQLMYDEQEDPESCIRVTYTYDDNGNVILTETDASEDGGKTWVPYEKLENTYDTVVLDFKTSILKYSYNGSDWALSYGNKYPIVRNEKGVVTSFERLASYMDSFEPIDRVTNTLSEDGNTIISYKSENYASLGNGELGWQEVLDLRDIQWHNTDGQVLVFEPKDLYKGANRLKSAKLYYYDELDATLSGEYEDDFQGSLTYDFTTGDKMVYSREYTDEATGSYVEMRDLTYSEEGEECNETDITTITYDEHGNLLSEREGYAEFGEVLEEFEIQYENTYNSNNALTSTIISMYDPIEDYLMPETRYEYSNFKVIAGVNAIQPESDGISVKVNGRTVSVNTEGQATCAVLAVDGRQLAASAGTDSFNLSLDGVPAGIYIIRVSTSSATKAAKVAIR